MVNLFSKRLLQKTVCLLFGMLGLAQVQQSAAQVSIPTTGQVTTNFNGWNGTLPSGWTLSGSSGATTYRGTSTTLNSGGTYSVPNMGFGFRASGSAVALTLVGTYINNTGAPITSLIISYDALYINIALTPPERNPGWAVSSSLSGMGTALNWMSTDGTQPKGPDTLNNLNIPINSTFTLSFSTDRGLTSGGSPQIGLNNVKIVNNTVSCTPVTNTASYAACSNQMPYAWGNLSLSTPGIYNQVFKTAVGNCDSTVTLNFSTKSTTAQSVALSKCPNEFPFNWNGLNITAATTYPQTYTTTGSNGCDSVVTLNVTKKTSSTGFEELSVCAGAYPFTWHGNTVTSSDDEVSYTLTNSQGCDSVVFLLITPSTESYSTPVSESTCTLPYFWFDEEVSVYGTNVATVTLQTAGGCDSVLHLTLTKQAADSIAINENACSNKLPFVWRGKSISTAGIAVATDTLVNQNGCDSILYLNLTINTNDSVVVTATTCSGSLPYNWRNKVVNTGGVAVATDTLVNQNGCDSILYLTLILSNDSIGETDSICAGSLPYTWRGKTINNIGLSVATDTVEGDGCDVVYHLNLFYYQQPNIVINQPAAKCFPGTVNLSSVIANTQTTANLNISYYNSSWQPISQTNVADSGLYYAVGFNNAGCSDTAEINVVINEKPIVITTNPDRVCNPNTVNIKVPTIVNGSTPGLNYTYWTNAAATQPLANPEATNYVGSKLYYLVGTNQYGCSDTTNVLVVINTKPVVVAYNPPAACLPNKVNLTAPFVTYGSTSNLTYTYWNSNYSQQITTASAIENSGIYHIIGKNTANCTDTADVTVNIQDCNQSIYGFTSGNGQDIDENEDVNAFRDNTSLKLYPNPSRETINVRFDVVKNSNVQYWISDVTGRTIINKQSFAAISGQNVISISVADLTNGIYYLHMQTATSQPATTTKFVVYGK